MIPPVIVEVTEIRENVVSIVIEPFSTKLGPLRYIIINWFRIKASHFLYIYIIAIILWLSCKTVCHMKLELMWIPEHYYPIQIIDGNTMDITLLLSMMLVVMTVSFWLEIIQQQYIKILNIRMDLFKKQWSLHFLSGCFQKPTRLVIYEVLVKNYLCRLILLVRYLQGQLVEHYYQYGYNNSHKFSTYMYYFFSIQVFWMMMM